VSNGKIPCGKQYYFKLKQYHPDFCYRDDIEERDHLGNKVDRKLFYGWLLFGNIVMEVSFSSSRIFSVAHPLRYPSLCSQKKTAFNCLLYERFSISNIPAFSPLQNIIVRDSTNIIIGAAEYKVLSAYPCG